MDMEGRSYSELYRNTSEELFIKAMMEGSGGMPAPPTMEMLGFKNLAQNIRIDSEELFRTWLTNSETNGFHSTGGVGHHRPRQPSRRITIEPASLTNQNMGAVASVAAESANDLRAEGEKGMQASNLFLAKAWFHSSQPMTRSRSSELRRRYTAMQQSQTPIGIEAMNEASRIAVNNSKQDATDINEFSNNISVYENPNQFNAFMSPTNSSSLTFTNPQVGCVDKISSVVSMLKGTLERKRLSSNIDKEESSFAYYSAGFNQEIGIHAYENQGTFQDVSMLGVTESGVLQKIEESLMEGIMGSPMNPDPMSRMSREPSQSESSVAPYIASSGFDMCDDPCISAQAPTVCESSRNQMGKGRNQDLRARSYNNSKQDQKKGGIIRYEPPTSTGSVYRDPTKKRRVERSRKMAEAKERSSTPAIPTDMQSILRRCENLEKEVRSLKLNLSFMNRKDSEQTKHIEELQKQNQELEEEKERLLEEIERIDSGHM